MLGAVPDDEMNGLAKVRFGNQRHWGPLIPVSRFASKVNRRMNMSTQLAPLILAVDDDPLTLKMARVSLEKFGFRVVEAQDGVEALGIFEKAQPDLVLLDVAMPRMDGFETCRLLRSSRLGSATPIVMATGRADAASIEQAFEAGATDFTVKPVNYRILSQRLRYILRAKRTSDNLNEHRTRLGHALRIAKLGYWHWDLATAHVYWSREALAMCGLEPDEPLSHFEAFLARVHPADRDLLRKHIQELFALKRGAQIEYRVVTEEGERFIYQETEFSCNEKGLPERLVGAMQDISQRRRAEAEIANLAYFDRVTGLPNRFRFKNQLGRLIEQTMRQNRVLSLLSIHLDHFRRIKASMRDSDCDTLLRMLAERLRHCVRRNDYIAQGPGGRGRRQEDLLARVGGDEFMIALADIQRAEDAARVANRVCEAVRRPFVVNDREIYVTVSIGISACPHDGTDAESLLRFADTATQYARKAGQGRYTFFTSDLNKRVIEELALESDLRKALERNEFVLHYQPKVRCQDQRPCGVEALLRWRRGDRLLSPGAFIASAEECGLIVPIDQWALRAACRQAQLWRRNGLSNLRVSVNLSAAQFASCDLADLIAGMLREAGVDGQMLELEITESLLMQNVEESVALMAKLKDMGLRLTIDDFGTGYSSLSYLKRLPIDTLKIDKSFVQGLGKDPGDAAIVSATIALAHKLGFSVVAEGVEREDQLKFLRDQGCDELQGYFFSRPVPPDDLGRWIAKGVAA